MSPQGERTVSPEEQLDHEKQIAKILDIRSKEDKPSPWWGSAVFWSTLGTVAGAIIALASSYLVKDRELEETRIEARVERIRKAAFDANDALASMLKANEERYLLATGQLGKLDSTQRIAIARATNIAQQAWRTQRENVEMGLILAFDADTAIDATWASARGAVEQLITCIETAYIKYRRVMAPKSICETDRERTKNALKTFRSHLGSEYKKVLAELP